MSVNPEYVGAHTLRRTLDIDAQRTTAGGCKWWSVTPARSAACQVPQTVHPCGAKTESTHPGGPALPGNITADVAIVGAGFTGLWAAYYLLQADPTLKVVLLEREYAGFGASGRNGGWASSIFPVSLGRVEQLYSIAPPSICRRR